MDGFFVCRGEYPTDGWEKSTNGFIFGDGKTILLLLVLMFRFGGRRANAHYAA